MPTRTTPPANVYEQRRRTTADKLRVALDRLLRDMPQHVSPRDRTRRLSVAALAREAGVGRNAIYTNHRHILDDLARARRRQGAPSELAGLEDKIAEQRAVIDDMRLQIRRLATENAALLKRAIEAERQAEQAERCAARLTREIDALRRPAPLRPAQR